MTAGPGGTSSDVRSAEGAGFEPAADIAASERFQGASDRPLRHPSWRRHPARCCAENDYRTVGTGTQHRFSSGSYFSGANRGGSTRTISSIARAARAEPCRIA